MTGHILQHSDAIKFIFAGNSTFTVLNTQTGNRFTYKVKLAKNSKEDNPIFFVKVLTNPDIYQFIGSISKNNYKHSQKSKISVEAQSVKVFQYILVHLIKGDLNSCVEIWHEGRCGKCGRPLTVPQSIEIGIGPDCLKTMMDKQTMRQIKLNQLLKES
jgi:hypothetical protein